MFKARSNNLNLRDRKRFNNQATECFLCGSALEDLKHFILHCSAYEEERKANSVLQQPYQEDEEEIIGQLLFNKENLEKSKILLETFWRKRTKKMKELE